MKKTTLVLMSLLALTTANTYAGSKAQGGEKRPDFNQLCLNKAVNTKVNAKHGDRTIAGTCQLGFKANNAQDLRGGQRPAAGQQRPSDVTANACKGKPKGTAVTVKIEGKNIAGKCDMIFKPTMNKRA